MSPNSMSNSAYIRYLGVHVEFPNGVEALRGVSLDVANGEFVFFVGRTGAGKSTLLKLLTCETRLTQGELYWDGCEISATPEGRVHLLRRQMGIVPQDYALLPKKRVWENLGYAMRALGHSRRDVRRRVPEVMDQVSIGHRADAFPHQLSGGEQQRVAIARALINRPRLLLADEPTGNLDPGLSLEIMALLARVNQEGTTVLVASHDLTVVHQMGFRMVTLEAGKVCGDTPARGVDDPAAALECVDPKEATE